MVYIETKYCGICYKYTVHGNGKCSECREREYNESVRNWNDMSLFDKVNDLRERVEELERGEPRY